MKRGGAQDFCFRIFDLLDFGEFILPVRACAWGVGVSQFAVAIRGCRRYGELQVGAFVT